MTENLETAEVAFRKDINKALIQDKKMLKKLDLYNYIQDMNEKSTAEIVNFIENMDPKTQGKHLLLMYYYHVGSNQLKKEMNNDSIQQYLND